MVKNKKTKLLPRFSSYVVLLALLLWIIALFLPAYTQISDPGNVISGGGAFLNGLMFSWIGIFGGDTFWLVSWFANICFFTVMAATLRNKNKSTIIGVFSVLMIALPLFAFHPGDIMFGNESNIKAAKVEIAVTLWYIGVALMATPPIFSIFTTPERTHKSRNRSRP